MGYSIIRQASHSYFITCYRKHSNQCDMITIMFRHNIVKVAVDPPGDSRVDTQTN